MIATNTSICVTHRVSIARIRGKVEDSTCLASAAASGDARDLEKALVHARLAGALSWLGQEEALQERLQRWAVDGRTKDQSAHLEDVASHK